MVNGCEFRIVTTLTDAQIDTYNRMIGNTPDMYDPESSVGRNGFVQS